ncbi:hypothetical protein LMG10661_03463 [Ralstonia syzygii subsp. syzygii]|nr:hypothetical protein LMG10661_03463 [Ralstonia syzygii subsp. syzygii]
MAFQSTVRADMAFGVPGELFTDGPVRAAPYTLQSTSPNIVGYAYTEAADGTAQVGGTGKFAGILVHPKHYASWGTPAGTLAPTMELPNQSIGELLTMGEIVVGLFAAAAGDYAVVYDTTTGALSAIAAGGVVPPGSAEVPNTRVSRYQLTGPGLAVITLTN